MDKNKNNTFLYTLLIGISFIFLLILLISSNTNSVEKELIIYDNINITNYQNQGSGIKIGELTLDNPSILPKKIKLENYVLCEFDNVFGSGNIDLVYRDSSNSNNIFNNGYLNNIELTPKTTSIVNLEINNIPYRFNANSEEELIGETLSLYLFEVPQESNTWNYCSDSLDKTSAKEVITATIIS